MLSLLRQARHIACTAPFFGRRHGEVRKEGSAEGEEGHARAKAGHASVRAIRQEGHQPQAGDRYWLERGASCRWEGPASKEFEEVNSCPDSDIPTNYSPVSLPFTPSASARRRHHPRV